MDTVAMLAELEEEFKDSEVETEDFVEEVPPELETEAEPEVAPEPEEPEPEVKTPTKEENAFARMRKENAELFGKLQTLSPYEKVIKQIAETSGMKPDEVVKFYEDKLIEDQAKQKGVTPEVIQLQKRIEEIENRGIEEKFNSEMGKFVEAEGLDESSVEGFFLQCHEVGIDLRKVSDISAIYRGFNFDKVLQKKLDEAEQTKLEQKKKRMETTGIQHGSTQHETTYDVDADVEATLKKFHVRTK